MKKSSTSTLYKTTAILTLLSIVERGLGFLYRLVLSRKLGEEMLGVYQIASSVFGVFLTVAVGGLPVTVSRLVARYRAENNPVNEARTLSSGLLLSLILSLVPTLLFFLFGRFFTPLLPDERCLPVLKILLLGSVFASAFAVLRGKQWGSKKFLIPTLFELLQEATLVLSGVFFLFIDGSLPLIERVAWANTLSYALSFVVALAFFFSDRENKLGSPLPLAKSLLNSTLPITSVRLGNSLLSSAVAILLPAMLVKAGMDNAEALKTFGVLSGMVIPVLFVPATLIGSFSIVLSPQLSEDFYKGNFQKLQTNIDKGLSAATLLSGILAPLIFVLGTDVGHVLFSSTLAGEMIKNGSPILLPMSVCMLSNTVLNSLGFEKQTLRFYFVGASALLLSVLFLPTFLGGYAYLVGMGLNFTLTACCNLAFLQKKCPLKKSFYKRLALTVALVLPLSLFGQFVKTFCVATFGEFFAMAVIGISFLIFALLLYSTVFSRKKKAFSSPKDVFLPKAQKIFAKLAQK